MSKQDKPKRPRIKLSPELVRLIRTPIEYTPEFEAEVKKELKEAVEKVKAEMRKPDDDTTAEEKP